MNTKFKPSGEVDILILGAGWTSTFLIPILISSDISYAATTTTGRDDTIKFIFDPDSQDREPYTHLPLATTVLITFPLKGKSQTELMINMYGKTHGPTTTSWIQLGSTSGFTNSGWNDHDTEFDPEHTSERASAEEQLLERGGCVLNLAGLYGGERDPKNWVLRVAKDKAGVKSKKSLHLIHGMDVARAIVAVHKRFSTDRWLLTDLHVYDWWDLIYEWSDIVEQRYREKQHLNRDDGGGGGEKKPKLEFKKWILELMKEENVRALPRGPEILGRALDSTAFWRTMGIWPIVGRVS